MFQFHAPFTFGLLVNKFPFYQFSSSINHSALSIVNIRHINDSNSNVVHRFDLIVIGGGSGGLATARRAAEYGAKVKIFESQRYGGTCVNVGCVPKKLMWNASNIANTLNVFARNYGFTFNDLNFNYKELKNRRDRYITTLNGIYSDSLTNANVEHEHSFAKFIDSETIQANGKNYKAKYIMIAVGGQPYIPDIPGKEYISTSDDFFNTLDFIPKKTAVIGAGYIAVELAQVLQGLGSDVSLFTRYEIALRSFDILIQNGVKEALLHSGVTLVNNCNITAIEKNNSWLTLFTKEGGIYSDFDYILYAVGRGPLATDLGLDQTNVKQDSRGFIISDEFEETSQKGIYALGDINNKVSLTPVAIRAGREFSDRMFGGEQFSQSKMDYLNVPSVIFSEPPVGSIGYTEEQVRELVGKGELCQPINIYESHFRNLMYGVFDNEEEKVKTHMKIICVGENEKVVGLHMIGEGCDEILQGFGVAIKMGATKKDFDSVVAIHPTAAEELVTLRTVRH